MTEVMQDFTAAELVLDARAEAGESPWWCVTEQKLYWVDIYGQRLHRFNVVRSVDEEWPTPDLVTFVAPHAAGGLVIALRDRVSFIETPGAGFRTVALPPIPSGGTSQ